MFQRNQTQTKTYPSAVYIYVTDSNQIELENLLSVYVFFLLVYILFFPFFFLFVHLTVFTNSVFVFSYVFR